MQAIFHDETAVEQVKRQGPFRPRKSKTSLMAEVFGPGKYPHSNCLHNPTTYVEIVFLVKDPSVQSFRSSYIAKNLATDNNDMLARLYKLVI